MSYEALETGLAGAPVELFLFQQREVCWQYTSADGEIEWSNRTYTPRTVSRGSFERNDEAGSSTVTVRMDRELKVVGQFIDGSTATPVWLTIYRKHRTDSEAIVLFKGVVANAELIGEEVILTCVSPLSAEEKAVPRELIMRTCPHVLYGPRCTLDPTDYAVESTVTYVSGVTVKVEEQGSFTSGDFTAGVLVRDSTLQRGFIHAHTYSDGGSYPHTFTLLQPMVGLAVSDDVTFYYGCDRKHSTCRDKFDNMPNFGGFPLHPERNPFLELKVQ